MEQGNKLSSFPIGGKLSVKITSVDYINPHDITFLLTGSGELSVIIIVHNIEKGDSIQLCIPPCIMWLLNRIDSGMLVKHCGE